MAETNAVATLETNAVTTNAVPAASERGMLEKWVDVEVDQYGPLAQWALTTGLDILLILLMALAGIKLAGWASRRLVTMVLRPTDDGEIKKRADTLSSILQAALATVVLVMCGMMLLSEMDISIGPLLASAGVVGLAIGFGAQNLVQDVISGFFILLEDQIRVGDVVQIADKGGLVERVTLRMVILRDLAGNVHYVRNGQIGVVTNMTKDFSRYVFDIGVAYRENVDEVIKVIREVDEELREDAAFKDDILAPIEVLGLDQFGDSAIIIKARTMTKPIQQWRVGREFNRRLKKRFDEVGIEIPYPHLTLYMGQDKQGFAPPMRVAMNQIPSSGNE